MSATLTVRPAHADDLPRLVEIYNHYVATSHVTFDTDPFTPRSRQAWFDAYSPVGPHRLLVAEDGGVLAGYASSSPLRPKPAYRSSVETTVYVAPGLTGRGTGRALYSALLGHLAASGEVHRAYGIIALPNAASIALHERLGFRRVATLSEAGYKFDRYWDVCWYEKPI